jgi:DNA primase
MRALLDTAEPLVRMLWRRETEGQVFDSPERRAALDGRLRQAINRIPDQGLRRHYGAALAELRRVLFRPASQPGRDRRAWQGTWRTRGFAEVQTPLPETRSSALGSGTLSAEDLRIMLILATLCRYPTLIERFEGDLDRIAPRHPDHAALVDLLLATRVDDEDGVAAECAAAGLSSALEGLRTTAHLRITPILIGPHDPDKAAECLSEEFAKYHAEHALKAEMSEALEDLAGAPDGDARLGRRLNHAVQRRLTASRSTSAEALGAVGEDTAALSERLRALIEARVWEKKGR